MSMLIKVRTDRWSLEEVISDELCPNYGAFAFVLDDEHFPHFKQRQSLEIAHGLDNALIDGKETLVALQRYTLRIFKNGDGVGLQTPSGAVRSLTQAVAAYLSQTLKRPLAEALTPRP